MKNTTSVNPRALALSTLAGVSQGQYGNIAVDTVLRRHSMPEADQRLFTALVYGVLERQITLDFLIGRFSDRAPDDLDATALGALRLGLYQLIYMDRIPDHAAVGETVSLVPRRLSGYVNAVLRAYLRFEAVLPRQEGGSKAPRECALTTPAAWRERFPELKDDMTAMSVALGMPEAMCRRFVAALGEDRAVSVLTAFGHKPPLTLRVNPLKTSVEDMIRALSEGGYQPLKGLYAPYAIRLSEGAVTALPGFDAGEFFVQDEASQLCVEALDAQPGHTVVDTCACPGSKSFGIALCMQNQGALYAFDLHQSKLSLISSGVARLGMNIVSVAERDARNPTADLIGQADRVLCDVPCSGLGVLSKKPEIRYKDLSRSDGLPAIQRDILEASSRYLKVGGVLVYSTCTILPEENSMVVTEFLQVHPEFEAVDFVFPAREETVEDIVSKNGMVTLLPDANRTDGFFIAKLRRAR